MSRSVGRIGAGTSPVTVSFGEKYASSAAFDAIYREGMALVEETAAYLDGQGRKDAKGLKPPVSLAYATESMRLTTRLMQLASWLLIRRAVNEGEMTADAAQDEHRKVRLSAIGRPGHVKDFDALPDRLRALVVASYGLHDRVSKLDQMISDESATAAPSNPLAAERSRLEEAFTAPRSRRAI